MSVAPDAAEPTQRDAPAAAKTSRVLVVHAEAETRQAIARGLAYEAVTIVEAGSARAAVDRVATESIDLILLDMASPDVGGIQLLRLLKNDSQSHDIPVIMVAGADQGDGVVDCLEAGAEDYLSHPLHPIVLRLRVGAALEKRRLLASEKSLKESLAVTRRSHDRSLQRMLGVHKLEFVQLQETIKALRRQLDSTAATAKAGVEAARSSAAAELRQLRATVRVLREQLDLANAALGPAAPPMPSPSLAEEQVSDGR